MSLFRSVAPAATLLFVVAAPGVASRSSYAERVELAKARQAALSRTWHAATTPQKGARLAEARHEVLRLIVDDLFPPWYGTAWDFNGTTEVPGEGSIACGYFVTTVLRDAGFHVQRVKLAQQASEKIVQTLVPPRSIWRFSNPEISEVLARIRRAGDGLYVVGLDYHVGFVVHEGERMDFCHSSYLGDAVVVCAPASADPAFVSRYYVVGKLLTDPMMESWLEGDAIRVN